MQDKKVAIVITPNWHDYARKYLSEFMASASKQDYRGEIKFFITDNETSEESFNYLKNNLPANTRIHRNNTNDGYAKGCNDSMANAIEEGYDFIAVFNIHTILEPNCLSEMVKALETDEKIGVVQSRMMLWPDKDFVSSLGNKTHFLGFGYCEGYRQTINNSQLTINNIFYPSGSSMLYRRELLEEIGLFQEEFWMYNEDQEIGWRIWLAGYKCVLAPTAVLYNKYEFQRSIQKFYWMDRNRILSMLLCYHFLTLILILPAFIVMEFGLTLFSLKTGWWPEKKKVWQYFLTKKAWKYILENRKKNQKLRKTSDRQIAKLITGRIWYQEVDDVKLRLINPVFDAYWRIVRYLIVW